MKAPPKALPAVLPALLPVAVSCAVMGLVWLADFPKVLGAHPWWSGTVVLIGAPVGLGLAAALGFAIGARGRAALFAFAALAALWIAAAGKAGFAASYAEDRLAGQMWYFGWIAAAAALAGLVHALTAWVQKRAA